jgi:hypothetical protein
MIWTRPRIAAELRRLHEAGQDLSYNALARKRQALVSAASYHFGSYRKAVERAGIEYAEIVRRPRWTKPLIIAAIKKAKRGGRDLHWSAVTSRRDELARAAFASLQTRLFGRWDRALHAAGLDADEVSQYRSWDRNSVLFELRERSRDGEPLNSGAVQQDEPALHAAAVRHFGNYERALRGAGIEPQKVRRRKSWQKSDVIRAIRSIARRKANLSDSAVRRRDPALHGAAARLFGTYTAARNAAGVGAK